MQINTLPRRLASAGAVGALAAVALVPATAQAAPATTAYTCGIPNLAGPYDVSIVTDVPGLPTTGIGAGTDVPADLLAVTNKVTVPKAARDLMAGGGYTTINIPDFTLTAGTEGVAATGMTVATASFVASADGATYTADVNGKNAAFNAPATGTHAVQTPAKFALQAVKADGSAVSIPCELKAGTVAGTVASVTTTANAATVTAKAKKVAAGQKATVKVKVAADNELPTGKLVAMIGAKKVGKAALDAKGKAVLSIKAKALKAGNNKVKISYPGDDYTAKGKGKVVVKVVR